MSATLDSALGAVVDGARIVVTVGSGGVGKTTTAALVGLHAARAGKRVLVMTVDPARRLANALGARDLDHELQRIELADASGELWATMLDMKRTFDSIVDRYARDARARDAILENRFYHHFSTSLAGAQELSASERLHEVTEAGDWDLIVLDTPPATNALDFFDAPGRFFDALDTKALQWVMQASTGGLMGMGAQFLFAPRALHRRRVLRGLGVFLRHFSGLLDGFRERTASTARLLATPTTRFVLVTAPDPATVREALAFRTTLARREVRLSAVVANRVHRRVANIDHFDSMQSLAAGLEPLLAEAAPVERMRLATRHLETARDLAQLADHDAHTLAELGDALAVGGARVPIIRVPLYARDVHSLEGLERMRADLFR